MTSQPPLFHPDYADDRDTSSQVVRWPGTVDANCQQHRPGDCRWPFCSCYSPDRKEDE